MKSHIELTHGICMAAGQDAGNANMRKYGRSTWAVDDWNKAAEVANQLLQLIE